MVTMNMLYRRNIFCNGTRVLAALFLGVIAGCGGGGGGDGEAPVANNTLTGTAATGAAMQGKIRVRGRKQLITPDITDNINADGTFSVTLEDADGNALSPPYILQATPSGAGETLYSAATTTGSVNVTPLTNIILANATNSQPEDAFAAPPDPAVLTATVLDQAETNLENLLGVGDQGIDLMNGTFKAEGGDATDDLLERVKVIPDTANNKFSILMTTTGSDSAILIEDSFIEDGDDNMYAVNIVGVDLETLASDNLDTTFTTDKKTKIAPAPESVDTTLTVAQLNSKGQTALLEDESVLAADAFFKEASSKAGSTVSNDADTARFFHAATRVIAFGLDLGSDGNFTDSLATLGDILDGAGCDTVLRADWDLVSCGDPANTSPKGNDLKSFMTDTVLSEMASATTELASVSSDFKITITNDGKTYEVDYGDALVLKAFYHTLSFKFHTLTAHDWDVDLDDAINNKKSAETIRSENSTLFSLSSQASSQLSLAKTNYLAALSSASEAITSIRAEGAVTIGAQELIDLGNESDTKIQEAKDLISQLTDAATGGSVIQDNADNFKLKQDSSDFFQLDLSPLFAGQVAAASHVPTITGDALTGDLTDNTIGGLFPDGVN